MFIQDLLICSSVFSKRILFLTKFPPSYWRVAGLLSFTSQIFSSANLLIFLPIFLLDPLSYDFGEFFCVLDVNSLLVMCGVCIPDK